MDDFLREITKDLPGPQDEDEAEVAIDPGELGQAIRAIAGSDLVGIMMGIGGIPLLIRVMTFEDFVKHTDNEPTIDKILTLESSAAIVETGSRDYIGIGFPAGEAVESVRKRYGTDLKIISFHVADPLADKYVTVDLTIEDCKQVVNALSRAIATAEAV